MNAFTYSANLLLEEFTIFSDPINKNILNINSYQSGNRTYNYFKCKRLYNKYRMLFCIKLKSRTICSNSIDLNIHPLTTHSKLLTHAD